MLLLLLIYQLKPRILPATGYLHQDRPASAVGTGDLGNRRARVLDLRRRNRASRGHSESTFWVFRRGRSDPSEEPTAAPRPAADHLGGAQGACKVSGRQRNAFLSGIASKLEGEALDEIARKE